MEIAGKYEVLENIMVNWDPSKHLKTKTFLKVNLHFACV